MLIVLRRKLYLTPQRAVLREPIITAVQKQKHLPRYHDPPQTASDTIRGRETSVTPVGERTVVGKIQCPWCKHTTIQGNPAIVCPVWPSHNWMYSASTMPHVVKGVDKAVQTDHWRVVDTRRMTPDVFRPDRYFNPKEYLNAVDPWRKTTPIAHRIPRWIQKYGTKTTLKWDQDGTKIRKLEGYSLSTWVNDKNYLVNDDGRSVVYASGTHSGAGGAGTFWGPAHRESGPIPSTSSDENNEHCAQSYAIVLAVEHALKRGLGAIEIRTDSPHHAETADQIDFCKALSEQCDIDITFCPITDQSDRGFETACSLAYDGLLSHIDLRKKAANKTVEGYSLSTWVNDEKYLINADGRFVVYASGTHSGAGGAGGAGTFWGPAHHESSPIPSTSSDENNEQSAQSYAVVLAIEHALKCGLGAIEIRTDSPHHVETADQIDFCKAISEQFEVDVTFCPITDRRDRGFETASNLAYNETMVGTLEGYSLSTWVNDEDYLINGDGRFVVYASGTHSGADGAGGAGTFWGPGHSESGPIPSTSSDENNEQGAQSYAIVLAVQHALKRGLGAIEIRTDSPHHAETADQIDFCKALLEQREIDVTFRPITDKSDRGFESASELAHHGLLSHIDEIGGEMVLLWQDREVRFDIDNRDAKERPGENTLAYFDPVEDTKGNNGVRGLIRVTNLRLIWETKKHDNLNLSIGLKTIINCQQKQVASKLRGNIEALHVLAKGTSSRFEFIFSCVHAKKGPTADNQQRDSRLVDVLNRILTSYRSSTFYRELHLRIQLFERKQLQLLNDERIYAEITGVWNLSAEQGNLGNFIFTSVRVIWYAESNLLFNVSLPWIQIENIKIRDSKFGTALVLISSPSSTKYTLGFRIDPEEKLREVGKQAAQLYKAHCKQPDFGVREDKIENSIMNMTEFDEDVEIENNFKSDPALLYATYSSDPAPAPVYEETLGLAIEQLPDDVTLQSLWSFK